jgi:hypothetical protein
MCTGSLRTASGERSLLHFIAYFQPTPLKFFVTAAKGDTLFLVRDIMYCKPGQARPMVQKFLALNKLGKKIGLGPMRVMTDVSAERYWTVVAEMEVESLEKYTEISRKSMENEEFQEAMKGYHDQVDHGRREIYAIEK